MGVLNITTVCLWEFINDNVYHNIPINNSYSLLFHFCDKQSLEERCQRILQDMEGSLTARDRVGIQDFVLLDAYTSETAFIDNLRKRFNENLIYVSATSTHMTS